MVWKILYKVLKVKVVQVSMVWKIWYIVRKGILNRIIGKNGMKYYIGF